MTGYQALANAIITQAADDYRASALLLKLDPNDSVGSGRLREIEKFFLSDWCKALTELDPAFILDRLRKENRR